MEKKLCEMEEEFLEPGDTDDIVLVTVIAVVGLVLFTNIILGIGYLKSKCKRKASRGKDLESNETKEDAINLLNRIASPFYSMLYSFMHSRFLEKEKLSETSTFRSTKSSIHNKSVLYNK